MTETDREGRRRFLRLAGAATVVGVAGCAGGSGGEETTTTEEATTAEPTTDAGDGGDGDLSGPVPEEYRTATSLGGTERNPDGLTDKASLSYQSQPSDGEQCSGCALYVPDKNGDGLGACALVEGFIEPDGWCVSYAPHES